jgi:hypothetical protein
MYRSCKNVAMKHIPYRSGTWFFTQAMRIVDVMKTGTVNTRVYAL